MFFFMILHVREDFRAHGAQSGRRSPTAPGDADGRNHSSGAAEEDALLSPVLES
jgi:hypothetical protein